MANQAEIQLVPRTVKLIHTANRWAHVTGRFARTKPLGFMGLAICTLSLLVGVFGNVFATEDPNFGGDYRENLRGPSADNWFGTDHQGRDVYSRVVFGTRVSLQVAFFAIVIGTFGGFIIGIISGYAGGKVDMVLQRITDSFLAFPTILLALTLVAVLGQGMNSVIIAVAIAFAPNSVRVTRGTVLSVRKNDYIDASRTIGASNLRIMVRHILPNVLAPFLIIASVALGSAILVEASLSFLGMGVPPPWPSWGRMLSGSASEYALIAPWLVIFPGLAITVLVLGFNLFGDALRDIWDPRLRGR